jgi:hypothetical protein
LTGFLTITAFSFYVIFFAYLTVIVYTSCFKLKSGICFTILKTTITWRK